MIEVILLERVERLGKMGDVVKVRPGFARNFLLPQKKALRATKENIAFFEGKRSELEAQNATKRSEAEKIAQKLEGFKLVMIRQAGDTGQLYGSVTAKDIAEQLSVERAKVEKTSIQIPQPIKTVGIFNVKLVLHPEVILALTINVARSAEEARLQAEGKTVVKKDEPIVEAVEAAEPVAEKEAAAG